MSRGKTALSPSVRDSLESGSSVPLCIGVSILTHTTRKEKTMRRWSTIAALLSFCILLAATAFADGASFELKGIEVSKGIDVGAIRYGTSFIGEVYDLDGSKVGNWIVDLNYKGFKNVGVCGQDNDIIWLKLIVCFTDGEYAGKRLVLGMTDRTGTPDVFWGYTASSCTSIGGFGCTCPAADAQPCTGSESKLASIPGVDLRPMLGTNLKVQGATIENGWLCHTFVIPRITGTLTLK